MANLPKFTKVLVKKSWYSHRHSQKKLEQLCVSCLIGWNALEHYCPGVHPALVPPKLQYSGQLVFFFFFQKLHVDTSI
jgi:hypothetical protein